MLDTLQFTEIQNSNGAINKNYTLESGNLTKLPAASVYQATAKTVSIQIQNFQQYLDDLSSRTDTAIMLGVWSNGHEYDHFDITTAGNEKPSDGLISRTKEYFKYCNSNTVGLMLLDVDGDWSETQVKTFLQLLEETLADALIGGKTLCHFEKPSSSSGVLYNGKPAGSGLHIYIPVKNPKAELLEQLYRFAWLHNPSHMLSKSGLVLSRTIIDEAVKGPERLVFESDATIPDSDQIQKLKRVSKYVPGGVLDSELATYILNENTINYSEEWEKYKEAIQQTPEVTAKISEYNAAQVEKLTKEGQTRKAAKRIVENRRNHVLLSSDVLITDADKEISVYDVLVNRDEYNNRSGLKDPLEPSYGKGKAKLFCTDNRVALHSFAHGSQVYELKFDYLGMERWMASVDNTELEECFQDFLVSSQLTPTQQSKIEKEVAKRLDVSVTAVREEVRDSKTKADSECEMLDPVLNKGATHNDIASAMMASFGPDYRIFGGSVYVFGKTIWNRMKSDTLRKKVATDFAHCDLCKRVSDYKAIASHAITTSTSHIVTEWKTAYGFPCSDGFYEVTDTGIAKTEYKKEHGIRYKLGFAPDASVKTPMWDKVLENVENKLCFQQMIGLTLAGMLTDKLQMAGVMYGDAGTGKGTTTRVMTAMLPKDRVQSVKLELMTDQLNVAKLADCVANFIPEIKKSRKVIPMDGFKMVTGGDSLTGKWLYQDPFEFRSTAAQVLSFNDWPTMDSTGSDIQRRLAHFIIRFKKKTTEKIDRIEDPIIAHELPGILAWAMIGVESYLQNGIDDEMSLTLFAKWAENFDSVARFLKNRCSFGSRKFVLMSGLYEQYSKFCADQGFYKKDMAVFEDHIFQRDTIEKIRRKGGMGYLGMELKDENDIGGDEG